MIKNLRKGFTLLELLIVITILAILTLVVVLFINPVEILKKSRDVQRMSDLSTVNAAVGLYLQDRATSSLSYMTTLGGNSWNCNNPSTLNGAIPQISVSTARDTAGIGGYASSTLVNYTLNEGSGWINVRFDTVSSGAPISKIPIDPTNASSTGAGPYFYRYSCRSNNTFEIDATLESDAYKAGGTDDKAASDGGNNATRYEIGTDLRILGTL